MRINKEEGDLLISEFLFNYAKLTIERDDFELFKKEIHEISIINIPRPSEIQKNIMYNIITKTPLTLIQFPDFEHEITKKRDEINNLVEGSTNKDFNTIETVLGKYKDYENYLMTCVDEICASEDRLHRLKQIWNVPEDEIKNRSVNEINDIISVAENDPSSNYYQIKLLYTSLILHFTFYRLGAFVIFKGKQNEINSALYLKEMWDHTRPDDAVGIILNDTPVQFDPLWLTYLHLYGGRNQNYWTKTSFGFSWGYDDYHAAENYLYQYYILLITKCIQKGNSILKIPKIEDLEMLKQHSNSQLIEWYEFVQLFQNEASEFLVRCDAMILDSNRWDYLFNNNAHEMLSITKKWIKAYSSYCKEIQKEIEKRRDIDQEKIDSISKVVSEGYAASSIVDDLAEIKKFNVDLDSKLTFFDLVHNIGNLEKRWFFNDDQSCPDFFFTELGQSIAWGERVHILETIKKIGTVEEFFINTTQIDIVFEKIKSVVSQMKENGFFPTVIFLPINVSENLVIQRHCNFRSLKIDENTLLQVINSNKEWCFNEIVILDKSTSVWTYKPVNDSDDRISVKITSDEDDQLKMNIFLRTTANYTIVNPDAVKIIQFDLSVNPHI